MGEWGLTQDDLERSAGRTRDAVEALAGKTQVHVTTDLGTDFHVSIAGRSPLCLTSYKARGQMMSPIPLWNEVAFAAIEDFTHGKAVVDGVMLGIGLKGQVKEPITWTLEGGRCVSIEGGEEAEKLRKAIDGVENATVIGEFAFGTSEKAPFGTPSEKGRIGTVHLALGDNHNAYPGGKNVSSLHLDGVFLNATLQIVDDGTYILKDGEWAL
jgi:aminopeptidase